MTNPFVINLVLFVALQVQELLRQLDEVQRRHDALERQVAALQQRALPAPQRSASCQAEAGAAGCETAPEAGSSNDLPEGPPAEGSAALAHAPAAAPPAAAQGRAYRASDYGGAGEAVREGLEAQLLEKVGEGLCVGGWIGVCDVCVGLGGGVGVESEHSRGVEQRKEALKRSKGLLLKPG